MHLRNIVIALAATAVASPVDLQDRQCMLEKEPLRRTHANNPISDWWG